VKFALAAGVFDGNPALPGHSEQLRRPSDHVRGRAHRLEIVRFALIHAIAAGAGMASQ
jgi:hypothetical protein